MKVQIEKLNRQGVGSVVGTLRIDGRVEEITFDIVPLWEGLELVSENAGTIEAFRHRQWIPEAVRRVVMALLDGRTVALPFVVEPA